MSAIPPPCAAEPWEKDETVDEEAEEPYVDDVAVQLDSVLLDMM